MWKVGPFGGFYSSTCNSRYNPSLTPPILNFFEKCHFQSIFYSKCIQNRSAFIPHRTPHLRTGWNFGSDELGTSDTTTTPPNMSWRGHRMYHASAAAFSSRASTCSLCGLYGHRWWGRRSFRCGLRCGFAVVCVSQSSNSRISAPVITPNNRTGSNVFLYERF